MTLLKRLYRVGGLALLWAGLAAALLVEAQPGQPRLEAGEVSPQTIRAPARVTYTSEIATERARNEAADRVEPVYSPPDRSQAVRQSRMLVETVNFLNEVRADRRTPDDERAAQIAALEPVRFAEPTAWTILDLPDSEWHLVVSETQRVVNAQMRGEIREARLSALTQALPNQIDASLSDEQAAVVGEWAAALIVPNTFLDGERTEALRAEARAAVAPVERTLAAGENVVRAGEVVSAEQVEALQALGLQRPARPVETVAATALFLGLVVFALALYMARMQPALADSPRAMALVAALLVAFTLGARLLMPDHVLLRYALPSAAAAMLVGVLLAVDLALVVMVALSLIVGFLTGSIEMVAYTFVGGLVAALVLWRVERLSAFIWTGALVGLTNVAVIVVFALPGEARPWLDWAQLAGVGLVNGAASASLALAGFYGLSSFLGLTTFLQLMELARPTNPLFRELLLKAPGTYHHSIIVSNLAERAAEAIGADVLLVRVGAYYHDVGKTVAPHFFIENQVEGSNPHDALADPYRSAELILCHVSDGLRLARRHKLPRRVMDFVAQHHGTTTVTWFYRQACERDGTDNVDPAAFRYPGPRPQTRETAILMLADAVEATARAKRPAGAAEIDALIGKIIVARLVEGELDECSLTLDDLRIIRESFVAVLQGIYHPRIVYPEAAPAELPTPIRDVPPDAQAALPSA